MFAMPDRAAAQRGNPVVKFDGRTIDEMIGDFMQEHRIPGMTLAIVQAPYVPRVVGYGTADVEKGLLASPNTLWNVGQLTRAYTAVAVMQLLEADKLSLDDRIEKYVNDLPPSWRAITLRHLLGHTSGLPDYTKQPAFKPSHEYEPAEILALVRDVPVNFAPGKNSSASATDFFLLGLTIEKASGMSYEEFVRKHQIERLGLKNTQFASGLAAVPHEATETSGGKHRKFLSERPYIDPTEPAVGGTEQNGKWVPLPRNSQKAWLGVGSIYASAQDISLWDIGLAGNMLVSKKENREFLYRSIKLNDGTVVPGHCGWRFTGHAGFMDIRGNVPGFSVYLSRFTAPTELVCVTLCANKSDVDLTDLARRIAGAFDRKLGPPAGPPGMTSLESAYPVAATADRLADFLKSKGIEIVARIDHMAAAKKQGLDLRPTQVLIFGNPAVGTLLMQARPSIALDLPLRVAVWEEADGTVWVGTHDVAALAKAHGIADRGPTVAAMRTALTAALAHATCPD